MNTDNKDLNDLMDFINSSQSDMTDEDASDGYMWFGDKKPNQDINVDELKQELNLQEMSTASELYTATQILNVLKEACTRLEKLDAIPETGAVLNYMKENIASYEKLLADHESTNNKIRMEHFKRFKM